MHNPNGDLSSNQTPGASLGGKTFGFDPLVNGRHGRVPDRNLGGRNLPGEEVDQTYVQVDGQNVESEDQRLFESKSHSEHNEENNNKGVCAKLKAGVEGCLNGCKSRVFGPKTGSQMRQEKRQEERQEKRQEKEVEDSNNDSYLSKARKCLTCCSKTNENQNIDFKMVSSGDDAERGPVAKCLRACSAGAKKVLSAAQSPTRYCVTKTCGRESRMDSPWVHNGGIVIALMLTAFLIYKYWFVAEEVDASGNSDPSEVSPSVVLTSTLPPVVTAQDSAPEQGTSEAQLSDAPEVADKVVEGVSDKIEELGDAFPDSSDAKATTSLVAASLMATSVIALAAALL